MGKRGNITGESFDIEVIKQIEARQTFLGVNPKQDKHIVYQNNKTAFLRLASSIDIKDPNVSYNPLTPQTFGPTLPSTSLSREQIEKVLTDRGLPKSLAGSNLAKQCVLFGGVTAISNDFGEKKFTQLKGVGEGEFSPKGFGNEPINLSSPSAYGWGGLGQRGYRPMPGIVDANITYYNRGALAKATVNCKVYSIEQLQIFDLLYFRIGYTMLLEWGHNLFIDNQINQGLDKFDPNLKNRDTFYTKPFDLFFSNSYSKPNQNDIIYSIKEQRANDFYNYDAMLGKITNFSWKFNNDGSYNITLNLIGLGDIIESLKINTSVSGNTGAKPSDQLSDEEKKIEELENRIEQIENQVTAAENAAANAQAALEETSDSTDLLTATVENFITKIGRLTLESALSLKTIQKIYASKLDTTGALFDDTVPEGSLSGINLGTVNAGFSELVKDKRGSGDQIALLGKLKNPLPKINDTLLLQYVDKKEFDQSDKLINQLFADVESSQSDFQQSIKKIIFLALNPGTYSKADEIQIDLFTGGKPVAIGLKGPGAVTATEYSRLSTIQLNRRRVAAGLPALNAQKGPLDYSYSEIKKELKDIYEKVKKEGNQKNEAAKNAAAALARANAARQYASKQLKALQQELALLTEKYENFPQSAAEYRDKSTFNRQLYDWIQLIEASGSKTTGEISEPIIFSDVTTQSLKRYFKNENPDRTEETIIELINKEQEENNKLKNPDFCKLAFKASSHGQGTGRKTYDITQYYVRLGYMLDWVTNNLLIYDDDKPSPVKDQNKPSPKAFPYMTIDTDILTNVCKHWSSQVSSDPKICIIPINYTNKYTGKKSNTQKIADQNGKETTKTEVEDFTLDLNWQALEGTNTSKPNLKNFFIEGEDDAARLMNIMVNIDFIAAILAQNVDANGKVTLLNFLNAMTDYMGDALGNVNRLNAVYDGESNQIKIVDENGISLTKNQSNTPPKGPKIPKIGRFRAYGAVPDDKGSFLNDIDFQVTLPPQMASMATIAAQSSGNIVGENATALSKLNTGLTDRIITKKLDAQSVGAVAKDSLQDPNVIFGDKFNQMNTFVEDMFENGKYDPVNIESLKSINRDVSLFLVGNKAETDKAPAPFFIPFNLSLQMDGLSGMKNYERFSITEEVLPYSYRSSDAENGGVVDFLIKGISHTISNNQWKTKIDSLTVNTIRKPGGDR